MKIFMYVDAQTHIHMYISLCIYIEGVLLPDRQTLRGDSRHEDKHY